MKLDIGQAWNNATALMLGNKDVLGIVAAMFFFLPTLAIGILAPTAQLEAAAAANPEQFQAAAIEFITANWPLFALYIAATTVGSLTVFALLGKNRRLTVGEALKTGIGATLPYLAATLLMGMVFGLFIALAGGIGGLTGSVALSTVLGIFAVAFAVVVMIRLILIGPVMAAENILNPIAAIKRSWQLVKGNTRRVFLFFLLLIVALIVVSSVLGIVFGLLGALLGGTAGLWAENIPAAILSAVTTVIMLSVYASVHHLLSGGIGADEIDVFE